MPCTVSYISSAKVLPPMHDLVEQALLECTCHAVGTSSFLFVVVAVALVVMNSLTLNPFSSVYFTNVVCKYKCTHVHM